MRATVRAGFALAATLSAIVALGIPQHVAHAEATLSPIVGDWEGTARGFPVSFEVVHDPGGAYPGYASSAFEDLVVFGPSNCTMTPSVHNEAIYDEGQPTPFRANGSFGLPTGQELHGRLTARRAGSLRERVWLPGAGGTKGCRFTLTWKLHPVHRRAVESGTWRLRMSDGQSQLFTVGAGGRLLTGITIDNCNGIGGADLFIQPDGTATFENSAEADIALHFRKRSATGEETIPDAGSSCTNPTLHLAATLIKESR